jgi:gliding motility-associated-like protein
LNPAHDYGIDTGWFTVCLTAWNAQGCSDSVCGRLYNNFFQYIFIPNVFTPGVDGVNDSFFIDILGESEYDLHIYNRWGQPVFHSQQDGRSWNGRLRNRGEALPEGTYYYIFHYRWERRDTGRKKVEGIVQLIRE